MKIEAFPTEGYLRYAILDRSGGWLGTQLHLSEEAALRWIQDTGHTYDASINEIIPVRVRRD